MYDCFKDKITKGRETFPLLWIISENLLHFGSWISAGYLLWYFWQPAGMPVLAIIWILLVIVIQVMLKKDLILFLKLELHLP